MRVYGQSLDTAKPADADALRGRFLAGRPMTHGFERRTGSGEVAHVINLPDVIAGQSRDEWLARFGNLSQLELAFDEQLRFHKYNQCEHVVDRNHGYHKLYDHLQFVVYCNPKRLRST